MEPREKRADQDWQPLMTRKIEISESLRPCEPHDARQAEPQAEIWRRDAKSKFPRRANFAGRMILLTFKPAGRAN
jgi:hypothetical protein